jgi:hypothetical protein
VGVLFATGSAVTSSFFWRRAFDQSPGGGYFDQAALLDFALALGGIICGSVALGVGLYRRQMLVPLLGLLVLVVSLGSLGVCGTSPWPRTYVPL